MNSTAGQLRVLTFLWTYVRRHLVVLCSLSLCIVLTTVCFLAQPFMYKQAIDLISTGSSGDRAVWIAASLYIVYGVGLATLALTVEQIAGLLLGRIEASVMNAAHSDAFARVQRLSTGFHTGEFAGSTVRKINRGVDSLENMLDRIWYNFLPTLALMLGFLVVLTYTAPLIGLAMCTGMLLAIAVSVGLNTVLARYQKWTDEQDTRITGNLVDSVSSNALVKSFAAEAREDVRHFGLLEEWRRRILIQWTVSALTTGGQYLVLVLIELTVLLTGAWLWYKGQFTAGGFVVIILYMNQLWGRLWDLGRNIRDYMRAVAHTQELVTMLDRPLGVMDAANAKPLSVSAGGIEFRDVRFAYNKHLAPVFDSFSVAIKPGEKVALVGHSGGGKSTFVKLLLRLYDAQSGTITIDGQNIAHVTQESLRSQIALVPQDPILFHRSIAENILYGKPGATPEEMKRVALQAHAHEFISQLPNGYETLVGERGVKLSGGERQRIAIARAMLADTPILVLDEATSSLDSSSEKYIQEALVKLMEGRTTIVIAHRLSTIQRADRILVIEKGAITEQGTHAELVAKSGGLYRHLYELQVGGFIGE